VVLGRIAHETMLTALGRRASAAPFAHGAVHDISALPLRAGNAANGASAKMTEGGRPLKIYDSYHCSRLNTNTGVLTPEMFRQVFAAVRADLKR